MKHTICLIEDSDELRSFLQTVLEDNNYITYTAESGVAGLKLVEKHNPELVILDIGLPDIDGKTVCKKIKNMFPHTAVLFVTGNSKTEDIVHGLDIGADDYITKPVDPDELLARIRVALRKYTGNEQILELADLRLDSQAKRVTRADTEIQLSAQEFKLLEYLLANKNIVVSRSMILSRIWDGSPDIETRVVDVYIGYLRTKIDFMEPKLVHTVRGFGYVLKVGEKN